MKNIHTILNKGFELLGYAIFCYPLWSERWSTFILTAWLIIGLFNGLWSQFWKFPIEWKKFIGFPLVFALIFINTYFDPQGDWKYLERSWSLFLIPLAYFLNQQAVQKWKWERFFYLFSLSSLLHICIGMVQTMMVLTSYVGRKTWPTYSVMFNDPYFFAYFRTNFEAQSIMHPTYAGYFLMIACLFLGYQLIVKWAKMRWSWRIIHALLALTSFILLAILAARGPLLFGIGGIFIILIGLIRKSRWFIPALTSIAFLTVALVYFTPSLNQRFKEIQFQNIDMADGNADQSFYMRYGILHCDLTLLKSHWLGGVGISQVQPQLNNCYAAYPKNIYTDADYNTHNQYFSYWLGLGLAGILAFLLGWGAIYLEFGKHRFYFGLSIALLTSGIMLTENLFERQAGIIPGLLILFLLLTSNIKGKLN